VNEAVESRASEWEENDPIEDSGVSQPRLVHRQLGWVYTTSRDRLYEQSCTTTPILDSVLSPIRLILVDLFNFLSLLALALVLVE
jgi:alkylated DNA repair dioxygenase AlkB